MQRFINLFVDIYKQIQARNHEFFRAEEFSWNEGTLKNIHLQRKREKRRGEKALIFCIETLKNYTLNEKFYP